MPAGQNIGAFFAKLDIDVSGWGAGMLQANALTDIFGQNVLNLASGPVGLLTEALRFGGAVVKDFAGSVVSAASNAERLGNLEFISGLDVELLQGLERQLTDAGGSSATLGTALTFLSDTMASLRAGSAETKKKLENIGIENPEKIKSTAELFEKVADAFGRLENQDQIVGAGRDLFGRLSGPDGAAFLQVVSRTLDGIKAINEELKKDFVIRPRADIEAFKLIDDRIDATQQKLDGFQNRLNAFNTAPPIITGDFFGAGLVVNKGFGFVRSFFPGSARSMN